MLQYTALIAAYKACPPYGTRTRYLSLSTPVCYPMFSRAPQIHTYIHMRSYMHRPTYAYIHVHALSDLTTQYHDQTKWSSTAACKIEAQKVEEAQAVGCMEAR